MGHSIDTDSCYLINTFKFSDYSIIQKVYIFQNWKLLENSEDSNVPVRIDSHY